MAVSSLEKKELLADYCVLGGSSDNRLSDVERMTLVGGDGLLKLLRRISRESVGPDIQSIVTRIDENHVREAAGFYSAFSDPAVLFKKPSGIIAPKITTVHGLPDEGEISDLEFESAYDGFHDAFSILSKTIPENRMVNVRYWRHKEAKRPTIVAVHGFAMGDQKVNSLAFLPGLFFRMGFDIALLELPFHGRRLTPEFRDVGHTFFPGPNIYLTSEGIQQAISDLRQLRMVLRALGCRDVGCMGISLGSYIASLWATLDQLSFCIPMVPLVSMSDLIWDGIGQYRPELGSSLDRDTVHASLRMHEASSYSPRTPADSVHIVAGKDDVVISGSHPERLSRHFGGAPIVWFSGDHGMSQDRDFVFSGILDFFKGRGFL